MAATTSPLDFIASISYDIRLAPYDIQGSIAHAAMLGKQRIIPHSSVRRIIKGLTSIANDLNRGWKLPVDEDIHFAIERELIRRIGADGQRLHTGRSRNDQVVTDVFLYVRDQFQQIYRDIEQVQQALVSLATRYQDVVMPGFTHLQHAQPVLFAHHILAYAWMFDRDKSRIVDALTRLDYLPLGSAALAGTSFPLDRSYVARLLKFKNLSENSIDATASRDGFIELVSVSSLIMSHLSRMAEELVIWSTSEFSFIKLSEEFTSGSSIMPQKRNPDVAEIIRGETGRVYGSLVSLLTLVKGLPLAYNRDLQEDKPPLFEAVDTVSGCLSVMAPMIRSLVVNKEIMERACDEGFIGATELADFLTVRGVPFRAAHGIVRKMVSSCEARGIHFDQLSLDEIKSFHPKFDAHALTLLSPQTVVKAKTSYGGTSPQSVARQIKKLKASFGRFSKK